MMGEQRLIDPEQILYGSPLNINRGVVIDTPSPYSPMLGQVDPLELDLNHGYFEKIGFGIGYSGTQRWFAQASKIPEEWIQAEPELPAEPGGRGDHGPEASYDAQVILRDIFENRSRLESLVQVIDFKTVKKQGCKTRIVATLEDGRQETVHSNPHWLAAVEELTEYTGFWYLLDPLGDKEPWEDDPDCWIYANSARQAWGWVERIDLGARRRHPRRKSRK